MKKLTTHSLVYLWTFPWDIITWLGVLFIWLCWGTKLHWLNGLWCELKPNSWPARTWYRVKDKEGLHILNSVEDQVHLGRWKTWGGTTFGHGGFYGPGRTKEAGIDTGVEFHEHVHVEQAEVALFISFVYGLISFVSVAPDQSILRAFVPAFIIWISGALMFFISGWYVAWVRGEDPYMGSQHEESAYAQTELQSKDK